MLPPSYWITGIFTALLVILCVLVHYEGLRLLSDRLPTPKRHHRWRMVLLILSLMFLHIVEIWLFGGAYFLMLRSGSFGAILGAETTTLIDTVYYSATVYTTIGFGDIYPVGAIRTMTGTEGVMGLLLITWSASYTFVEMLRWWNDSD